jgi:rhomboid protease GluP
MCPSCGKLMGTGRICPYCGADAGSVGMRLRVAGRRASGGDQGTPATFVLLVVMVGIYLASIAFGGVAEGGGALGFLAPTSETQTRLGALVPSLIDQGEWWRIVTAIFLHGGIIHLLMNGLFMWVLGRAYEEEVGAARFLGLFLGAGIVGFIASYSFGGHEAVGASGGGFGLVGAVIGRRRVLDGNFRDPRTMRAFELAILNLAIGFAIPGIDNWAHLGGLVTGVAIGFLQTRFEGARVAWTALGVGLALVALTSGVMAVTSTPRKHVPTQVVETNKCMVLAARAPDLTQTTVDVEAAERAARCFEHVGPIGIASLDAARLDMLEGITQAARGRRGGSVSDERRGLERLVRGVDAFIRDVDDNGERYGVRRQ